MASPLQPEFFALLGLNIFLALSLLACLLERNFPAILPYVYQSAALFGFGQLWVTKEFLPIFGDDMRLWYHLIYLSVAIANVIAIDLYIAFRNKQKILSWIYSGTVVLPLVLVSLFFVSVYTNSMPLSLPPLPPISFQSVYLLLALCIGVLAIGIMTSTKPRIFERIRLSRLVPSRAITSSVKSPQQRVTRSKKGKRVGGVKKRLSRLVPTRTVKSSAKPLQKGAARRKKVGKKEKLKSGGKLSRLISGRIRIRRLIPTRKNVSSTKSPQRSVAKSKKGRRTRKLRPKLSGLVRNLKSRLDLFNRTKEKKRRKERNGKKKE